MVTTSTSGGCGAEACFLGAQAVNATRGTSKERSRIVFFILGQGSRARLDSRGSRKSTDGDERNPLVAVIASDSARFWVKRWRAIYKKHIAVMTMMEFQTGHPTTI